MSWAKMNDAERLKYLSDQMRDIEQAKALLDRFEKVTNKWLKKVEGQPKQQAPGQKPKRK
jgi:hypothetical protein